ncbi:MAG: hypothetical protein IPG45_32630 [Deltaproteobacteria bacterium]|jgi:hypothetical protein|nr:hypothetical protein [Deltaproteobacteria bacterium]
MDFLNRELFAGWTVLQVGGGLLGLIVVGSILGRLRGRGEKIAFAKKKCRGCGWEGPGGPQTKKCAKCGAPLYTVGR